MTATVQPTTAQPLGAAYPPSEVYGAAMLAGPLAAFWMMAANERVLGKPTRAWILMALGVATTVLMFAVLSQLATPPPAYVLTALNAFAFGTIGNSLHGDAFKRHIALGGPRRSFWAALGVVVASIAISLVIAFAVHAILALAPAAP